MRFIINCQLGADVEAQRLALRAEHLAYIDAHRAMIVFGGPSLTEAGTLHTMTIVIEAPDLTAAQRFSSAEPYTAHGVFAQVSILRWVQVLPEAQAGALQAEITKERTRNHSS